MNAFPPVVAVSMEVENRWVAAAQSGSREAVGRLYGVHAGAIRQFIGRRVRNRYLVDDLTSETFLRGLAALASYRPQPGKGLRAWLTTIARNLIADHVKSGRARYEVLCDEPVGQHRADLDPRNDPERLAASRDYQRRLRAALVRVRPDLTDEQWECLRLRFWEDLSVKQTAEAMGSNDGAIKALQYRAVRHLARVLRLTDPWLIPNSASPSGRSGASTECRGLRQRASSTSSPSPSSSDVVKPVRSRRAAVGVGPVRCARRSGPRR